LSRPARLILIVVAVLAFLFVTLLVTQVLSAQSGERAAVVDLLRAEARGDAGALVRGIDGCGDRPGCVAAARRHATRLRRAGKVDVIRFDQPSRYALSSRTATVRVVWRAGEEELPVVQCARVRREGSLVGGFDVTVLTLGDPIDRQAACPGGP
jgi:hypothetical protein